jgi:hypothetical protein
VRVLVLVAGGIGAIQVCWLAGGALAATPLRPDAAVLAGPPIPVAAPAPMPAPSPPAPPPSPSPIEEAVVHALAGRLPAPAIHTNPSPFTVVNIDTWLWIDPNAWQPVSVSLNIAGVPVIASALPGKVTWVMGDSGRVYCDGPGVAYDQRKPPASQHTNCSYSYRTSSASQASPDSDPNDAAYSVRATVDWNVTWTTPTGAGAGVQPLETTTTAALRVEQIETIGTRN